MFVCIHVHTHMMVSVFVWMSTAFPRKDVAATIYFSSTAMRRLFEGGDYSKYRHHDYCLFQLYRNAATIRGWLLFEVQTSRLLFISALPQCGDYSRAAIIRSTDITATIFISALPQCGDYSRAATIRGAAFIRGKTVSVFFCLSVCLSLCQSLCVCVSSFMSEFLRVNYSTPHCGKNLYSRKCPTVIP